jgi:hypothetical protein
LCNSGGREGEDRKKWKQHSVTSHVGDLRVRDEGGLTGRTSERQIAIVQCAEPP